MKSWLFLYVAILTGWNVQALTLTSTLPHHAANSVSRSANIEMYFDTVVDGATVNDTNIVITGSQTGLIVGIYSGGGTSTITFNPAVDFKPGEVISVTITIKLESMLGDSLTASHHLEFRAASDSSRTSGATYDTHTITTGAPGARAVYAADVDGDGDMDVLSASSIDSKIVWYENVNQVYSAYDYHRS